MSDDFIKFSFAAGVLSDTLHLRSDLEKFDFGLAEGTNWFVDYRGGASTRPGSQFIDYIQNDIFPVRLVEFKFNTDIANTYIIMFGQGYIRFIQDGAYVLESDIAITDVTQADPGVIVAPGHGFSTGDWVKINGIDGPTNINGGTYQVTVTTVNRFTLTDPFNNVIDTSSEPVYVSGGTVNRVYTLASDYLSTDFRQMSFSQIRDEVTITHVDYPPRKLSRFGTTNWTLTDIDFGNSVSSPNNIALNPTTGTSNTSGVVFGVTAVVNGEQSIIADYGLTETTVNYTAEEGSMEVTWDPVTDVDFYNVYRSLVYPTGTDAMLGTTLGFVGQTLAPRFVDTNIVPDFTVTPPVQSNPFVNGGVARINVTAGGSGYSKDTATVTLVDGTGSGFSGTPIVDNGAVIGVIINDAGGDYTSPTVSFTGGTGATAIATLTPATGNNPRTTTLFEQRRVYAGTTNQPMTIFGSQPTFYDNFDVGQVSLATDSFNLTIDAEEVTPIKHIEAMPNGLLAFTQSSIWQIRGADDAVITSLNAKNDPVSRSGCADVRPITIDEEIIYVQDKGAAVKSLRPGRLPTIYENNELSLYSNNFFSSTKIIESWSYAEDPYKIIWAQRADGRFLAFTYVPSQNVYAWMPQETLGFVEDIETIQEDGRDSVYMVVKRQINGTFRRYVERLSPRAELSVEEMWAVDAGLRSSLETRNAALLFTASIGTAVVTSQTPIFTAQDVDRHIRYAGGRALVTAFRNTSELEILWEIDPKEFSPMRPGVLAQADGGTWTIAEKFTVFGGLDHLEGETVEILADGNEKTTQVVMNGSVTLNEAASLVTIGLGYTGRLKTLPLLSTNVIIENKYKRITGASLRLFESRGLFVGDDIQQYPIKDRTDEDFGEPTRLQNGIKEVSVEASWDRDGSLVIDKKGPLQASVLGLVLEAEVGDD